MRFLSIYTFDPSQWSGEPDAATIAKMGALISDMTAAGTLIDTGGRTPTGVSLRTTSTGGSPIAVTDGPFAESKEVVGGYAVLDVRDRAHLLEVAQRFLDCSGGGTCTMYQLAEMNDDDAPCTS
ncbi:MAG: YciI family protein [Candidatus Aquilonibacter sp.]